MSWNGISLNSPFLGNFDFSQIPVFFVDNISLYHGIGGFNKSSGALGGSVNIGNSIQQITKQEVKLLSEYGTDNTFTEALSYKTVLNKFKLSTRVYYQQSDNNYKYMNKVMTGKPRSEERRVGKECGSTVRYWVAAEH